MKRLENKVAIITGGAAGIGAATSIRFAAEGAVTVIWDLDEARGNELATKLTAEGKTEIDNIYQIERGYQQIAERLRAIGADIERVE